MRTSFHFDNAGEGAGEKARASRSELPAGTPATKARASRSTPLFVSSVLAGLFLLSVGCVTVIPVDEYAIARAAIEGAKDSEAPRFAPALWYKAEQAYREGETLFRERAYSDANERFEAARTFAEQAENAARISRFESGEMAP